MSHAKTIIAALFIPIIGACQLGPKVLRDGHQQYTEAIRRIDDEQMLLNLVRMRYSDRPVFLPISSISTQFAIRQDFGINGMAVEDNVNDLDNADSFGINGSFGYEERPTITYALPDSREFYGRMLAPLGAGQLSVLAQAGWDADYIFALGVKKINGLENLTDSPYIRMVKPPTHEKFKEAIVLIQNLKEQSVIDFGYNRKYVVASSPIKEVTAEGLAQAQAVGTEFYTDENGDYVLYTEKKLLHIRFARNAVNDTGARRLRELLKLTPERQSFAMIDEDDALDERARIGEKDYSAQQDDQAVFQEIVMQNRSMMEVLIYTSAAVELPEAHMDTSDEAGNDYVSYNTKKMFHIKHSRIRPRKAATKVRYQDYWFYIDQNDISSRRMLGLLHALYASIGGTVPGAKPVLTLPVG